jgi:FkbM family methyltransferase
MNKLTWIIRKAVRRAGFDMIHYVSWENLFRHCGIDMILDVGANRGQSYDLFRWSGFNGLICSFEPNPEMFQFLQSRQGHHWQRLPYALSSRSGQARFHITDNDNANSLQAPLGKEKVTGEITVPTYRLDHLWHQENFSAQKVFLKVDTEGHDLEVVKGASGILDRIQLIMLETSPLPRYENEPPLPVLVDFMNELGFCVCRSEKNCYNSRVGMDTALDLVFARRELIPKAGSG